MSLNKKKTSLTGLGIWLFAFAVVIVMLFILQGARGPQELKRNELESVLQTKTEFSSLKVTEKATVIVVEGEYIEDGTTTRFTARIPSVFIEDISNYIYSTEAAEK